MYFEIGQADWNQSRRRRSDRSVSPRASRGVATRYGVTSINGVSGFSRAIPTSSRTSRCEALPLLNIQPPEVKLALAHLARSLAPSAARADRSAISGTRSTTNLMTGALAQPMIRSVRLADRVEVAALIRHCSLTAGGVLRQWLILVAWDITFGGGGV